MDKSRLVLEATSDQVDLKFLSESLHDYNSAQTGVRDERRLALFVKDEAGQIVAGLSGWTYYGWLAIDLLWVREDLRGQGLGHKLINAAEEEAIFRGCTQVQLDTFDFQAPEFYRKHGYEVFGVLDGFAGNHKRYYLRKNLIRGRS
jgi:GNAT superfamily N-acetyltransferase